MREALPAEVTLVDLGEQRLRDLTQSLRRVPGRPSGARSSEFPPSAVPQRACPGICPARLTTFVGRDDDMAEAGAALGRADVVDHPHRCRRRRQDPPRQSRSPPTSCPEVPRRHVAVRARTAPRPRRPAGGRCQCAFDPAKGRQGVDGRECRRCGTRERRSILVDARQLRAPDRRSRASSSEDALVRSCPGRPRCSRPSREGLGVGGEASDEYR